MSVVGAGWLLKTDTNAKALCGRGGGRVWFHPQAAVWNSSPYSLNKGPLSTLHPPWPPIHLLLNLKSFCLSKKNKGKRQHAKPPSESWDFCLVQPPGIPNTVLDKLMTAPVKTFLKPSRAHLQKICGSDWGRSHTSEMFSSCAPLILHLKFAVTRCTTITKSFTPPQR